jgi:hypothetical protein
MKLTTLNMLFSVTYYLELHIPISFAKDVVLYPNVNHMKSRKINQ